MESKYKTTVRLLMPWVEYAFTGSIPPVLLPASGEVLELLPLSPGDHAEHEDDRVGRLIIYGRKRSMEADAQRQDDVSMIAHMTAEQPVMSYEATQVTPDTVSLDVWCAYPQLDPVHDWVTDILSGKVERLVARRLPGLLSEPAKTSTLPGGAPSHLEDVLCRILLHSHNVPRPTVRDFWGSMGRWTKDPKASFRHQVVDLKPKLTLQQFYEAGHVDTLESKHAFDAEPRILEKIKELLGGFNGD